MIWFKIIYFVAMVVEIAIRAPFQKTWKGSAKTDQRVSMSERIMLGLLFVFMALIPLIYSVTDWLSFADYSLPVWMGWLGALIMVGALVVFALAHRDLKAYWSPSLEIFEGHKLMTEGIYRYIRHPMYASQWLWVIAQTLLLQNWLAGPMDLVFFVLFYFMRVSAEEKMLVDTFGDQYREYMKKTGRVIPKF